jgi:transcriptional antiterminator NusG
MDLVNGNNDWYIGQWVRVLDGPLIDLVVRIVAIDWDRKRVTAVLNLFGKEIPNEFDFSQIVPVE